MGWKVIMKRRWSVLVMMVLFCMMVSACGNRQTEEEVLTPTGYPSGEVQRTSVFYGGFLYLYSDGGFNQELEEGFTKVGAVEQVDQMEYPAEDFHGTRIEVGQEVFADSEDVSRIFIKYDDGYAVFGRVDEPEEPDEPARATESGADADKAEPEESGADLEDILLSAAGTWELDGQKTEVHLKNYNSLQSMFGTGLGTGGASVVIEEDGSFRFYIGIGIGGTGQCEAAGPGFQVLITPYERHGEGEQLLQLHMKSEQGTDYLIMEYAGEELYWVMDEGAEKFFEKDGTSYQKVQDLIDGGYHWASAVTEGKGVKDDYGQERIDYNSQKRSFECLDDGKQIEVRRWDNLYYSAGDYLIFEYDGTMHVSRADNLYQPVLSYQVGGTYGIINKVPGGYMVADDKAYTAAFYDEGFQLVRLVEGYRCMEEVDGYRDGLITARDMETGLVGFMDQAGAIVIPCEYEYASSFYHGYAGVLVDAVLIPYTEDGGTVAMFQAEGGQWGIIDRDGSFVIEPSERFANQASQDPNAWFYCGTRRFSRVRVDGTVDFMDVESYQVIETVQIHR